MDPKNGYCPDTKTFQSLRPSVPLPPLTEPLSIIQYTLSLLNSPTTGINVSATTFLVDATTGHRLSYADFLLQTQNLVSSLQARYPSLSRKGVAFVLSPTSIHVPVVYFALLSLGIVVSPANPLSSSSELTHMTQLCKPLIAFATSSTAGKLPAQTKTQKTDEKTPFFFKFSATLSEKNTAMDSRSGGKIVTNRRKRYAVGPYDRPQPSPPSEEPLPKSPNWLTGHVFPATRTILSGAAKILTSVFKSDSSSSSSSDGDSMFDDDAREENDICSEADELNKHPQLSEERSQTKHLIEQLLMQETFSRKERDRLVMIINSRVVDSSLEGEGSVGLHLTIPDQTIADDTLDHSSQAIIEARKWLEEKRDGLRSDNTLGGLSSVVKNVDDTFGSPVEMAKSYMKIRPPWASPAVDHSGLRTPSQMKAKLFDEETPYTVSGDSLSSMKKKNSFASGSWNIHEEIRKVRSKATEDLLRAHPSKETDYQLRLVECKAEPKSAVGDLTGTSTAEKINDSSSLRLAKLSDVPIKWSDVEITQDGGESETGPLNPASSIQLQDQAIRVGEHAACESDMPNGPIFPSEHNDGLHITGSDAQEVTRPNLAQSSNGYTSLEPSLSAGQTRGQNDSHVGGDKPKPGTSSQDKSTESHKVEDKCELLSESAVDVPDMNETTGSPAASLPTEELLQEEPGLARDLAKNGKVVKQQVKRPVRNARKTRAKR